jgi:3-deoxy-D-manno-octulosonic-acid transferase
MLLLYRILIFFGLPTVKAAALFHPGLHRSVTARAAWRTQLEQISRRVHKPIVVHCASLGEFDQAYPIIRGIREAHPDRDVVVSFFSPSGYEKVRQTHPELHMLYLPWDTPGQMRRFTDRLDPSLFLFAKYEFWPNLLSVLAKRNIPYVFFSCVFRKNSSLMQPWMAFLRQLVFQSRAIFVQDDASAKVLAGSGYHHAVVIGDTRVDRVIERVQTLHVDETCAAFMRGRTVLILGSVYSEELDLVTACVDWAGQRGWRVLLAPHEVRGEALGVWLGVFPEKSMGLWSKGETERPILMLDTIGLLAPAYSMGHAAYIGGGFGKNIHNTLEPAAAGIPIAFGPQRDNFVEAEQLLEIGAAFEVRQTSLIKAWLAQLENEHIRVSMGQKAGDFIASQAGASERMLRFLTEEKNLA